MKVSQLFPGNTASVTGADVEVSSLVYDSRRVSTGSLFAALVGARADGHDHIQSALDRGAAAILCQKSVDTGDATCVLVDDSLDCGETKTAARAGWLGVKEGFEDLVEHLGIDRKSVV